MFLEKVAAASIIGVILGVLATIAQLFEGHPFFESLKAIPAAAFLGALCGIWWWWRSDEGDSYVSSSNPNVQKLQNDLRVAFENAAYNASKGDQARAGYWRSRAAVLESELRNLGA